MGTSKHCVPLKYGPFHRKTKIVRSLEKVSINFFKARILIASVEKGGSLYSEK